MALVRPHLKIDSESCCTGDQAAKNHKPTQREKNSTLLGVTGVHMRARRRAGGYKEATPAGDQKKPRWGGTFDQED